MPLYEYECRECKTQSEILVSKPDSEVECPACGSEKLAKLLSVVSSPVINGGARSAPEPGPCGRSACASGCMFGEN